MTIIYKICPASLWREAERDGAFRGSADDLRDGFIHFSAVDQVEGTARKHFAGQTGLLLVAVDADALGDALKWESSRGGQLFPHFYAPLPVQAALRVDEVPVRADGTHDFGGLLS